MVTLLKPIYTSAKTFGEKAIVTTEDDGTIKLQSYDTLVAEIDKNKNLKLYGWFSNITGKHINEFLLQNEFPEMTKKEIERYVAGV